VHVEAGVVGELRQLGVDVVPGVGTLPGLDEFGRDGLAGTHRFPQRHQELIVVPAVTHRAYLPDAPCGRLHTSLSMNPDSELERRSRCRHRPRSGPMLPIGTCRTVLISLYECGGSLISIDSSCLHRAGSSAKAASSAAFVSAVIISCSITPGPASDFRSSCTTTGETRRRPAPTPPRPSPRRVGGTPPGRAPRP